MGAKIRWLKLGSKESVAELGHKLRKKSFDSSLNVSHGFRIERISDECVFGQFISKRVIEQLVSLPTGEEFQQEIAQFEITAFQLLNGSRMLLRMDNAARSTSLMLNAIAEATQFSCSIDPIEVDVKAWIDELANRISGLSISYLDISGIRLSDSVEARIALRGDTDVAKQSSVMLGERKGTIEVAKVNVNYDYTTFVLELGRRAAVRVPSGVNADLMDLIKESMLLASTS
jgi:hypothetical protein